MPEPTRQSICCSQPEHGPILSHQMSQGRKKHITQDLSHTVRALWPLSYGAARSTCDNFHLLGTCRIRRDGPFAARSPSTDPHWPPNVTGEKRAHGPTGTRTQNFSHNVRALWPLSYRVTRSTCDINALKSVNIFNAITHIPLYLG